MKILLHIYIRINPDYGEFFLLSMNIGGCCSLAFQGSFDFLDDFGVTGLTLT